MTERFVGCCKRQVKEDVHGILREKGRQYIIKDIENKIPVMHFILEKDMWSVYELLESELMVFEE